MFYFYNKSFSELNEHTLSNLYVLRKQTFKDRLDWAVTCQNGMEYDEYDNENTQYIFGVKDNTLICSVRFIEMKHPNMITHTFRDFFTDLNLPEGNFVESSRFFVDKVRAGSLLGNPNPATYKLFLAMLNYAREKQYDGILTLVSHPMMLIVKRSGWNFTIISKGSSEKDKGVYILKLHTDQASQVTLQSRISRMEPDLNLAA